MKDRLNFVKLKFTHLWLNVKYFWLGKIITKNKYHSKGFKKHKIT